MPQERREVDLCYDLGHGFPVHSPKQKGTGGLWKKGGDWLTSVHAAPSPIRFRILSKTRKRLMGWGSVGTCLFALVLELSVLGVELSSPDWVWEGRGGVTRGVKRVPSLYLPCLGGSRKKVTLEVVKDPASRGVAIFLTKLAVSQQGRGKSQH